MSETMVITLTLIECANCHMVFGVYSNTVERWQKNGETFYCPKGHSNWYGESEASRLRKSLENKERSIEFWRNQNAATTLQLRAKKGQLTKLKNKIAAGTCPCCSQDFPNIKKHIETEHPDFVQVEKNGNEN